MSFFSALVGRGNPPPAPPAVTANNSTGFFGYLASYLNYTNPYTVSAPTKPGDYSHPLWENLGKLAPTSSAIPAPSTTAGPWDSPKSNNTVFGSALESVRLFGEALAEQSESSEEQNLRWDRFGSLAAYAFSIYGISTFLVALILNRTTVIASSASSRAREGNARGVVALFRRSPFSQNTVLAFLRLTAIVLMVAQASNVLVALSVIGQNEKAGLTSRLTKLASQYFTYDPTVYSQDKYMKMPRSEVRLGPTTYMLWPVFLTVSYSLFVETFAAAIGNTKPFLEGGLTLFELSLAIQEMSSGFFFLREYHIAKRPTEPILLICLFSIADQIANHAGAVLYKNKYRLIPSTVISSIFVWYFCSFVRHGGLFQLPSEIALTYLALVLTLGVTIACACIFLLTMLTKGARVDELNFANFFAEDHPNSEFFTRYLGLDLSQDFYTAVINLGMVVVTQTGKSSYFMAFSHVPSPRQTWLENDVWEKIKTAFEGLDTLSLSKEDQTSRILRYLDENHISGYNNIISKPSKRLINGADQEPEPIQRVGTIHKRILFFKETLARFFQLLIWALLRVCYYWPKDKVFGRSQKIQFESEESEAAFDIRRRRAPAFIRHLLMRNEMGENSNTVYQTSNDLGAQKDARTVLHYQEEEEEDESPDFELLNLFEEDSELDLESDAEVIDVSTADFRTLRRDDNHSTGFSSAISELMTADNFVELLDHKEILHHHLQYEYEERGMMTRSRYRALTDEKPPVNQTADLIELILAKRKKDAVREAQAEAAAKDDDFDDIDPRIACVICQTEPRTLITWPCKCFAICEGCRVSLVSKGMKGCVCCRQDVEGVSRIFLP